MSIGVRALPEMVEVAMDGETSRITAELSPTDTEELIDVLTKKLALARTGYWVVPG